RELRELAGCSSCRRARSCGHPARSTRNAPRSDIRARNSAGKQSAQAPGARDSMIRIANGQGFWGDWLEAPVRLIEQGPIDYLTLDYLAEVTMSILHKQRKA